MRRALARIAQAWRRCVEPPRLIRIERFRRRSRTATGGNAMAKATMDRNLALEAVRVTEAAALAASKLMGRGDEKAADQAAVDAMRRALNGLAIDGTVVIGEGERDEAPMLYHRREGGRRRPADRHRARSAGGHHHHRQGRPERAGRHRHGGGRRLPQRARRLHGQDRRRRRPARGRGRSRRDAGGEPEEPRQGQEGRRRRPRRLHPRPAAPCRADRAGARGGCAHHADLRRRRQRRDRHLAARQRRRHLLGSGGAPEGVLAAAALRCIGGQMQGRLLFRNDDEKGRAPTHGASPTSTANTRCSTWPRAT